MSGQNHDEGHGEVSLPDYLRSADGAISLLESLLGRTESLVLLLEGDDQRIGMASAQFGRMVGEDPRGHTFGEYHLVEGDPIGEGLVAFACRMHAERGDVPVSYQVASIDAPDRRLTLLIGRDLEGMAAWCRRFESKAPMQSVLSLAGGIAHELNNLFGGIISYADFALNYDRSPEAIRKGLAFSLDSLEKAVRITDNLRSFAQVSFKQFEPLDLAELLNLTLTMLQDEFEQRGCRLERDFQSVPSVQGEHEQIKQVMRHLIVNALQAVGDSGEITVRLWYEFPFVKFSVSDNGHGIPEESLDKVFEPFFTTRGVFGGGDTQGTGLGLAVSQGIVETHGGRIEVESTVGEGTAFTVSLPMSESNVAQRDHAEQPKVLIADDDEDTLFVLSQAFEVNGFRTIVCESGMEALSKASREKPGAIILDLRMPRMNGIEVLKNFHQIYPSVPVIMITGAADRMTQQECLDAGAKACLLKPIDLNEIVALVKGYVLSGEGEEDGAPENGE